MSIPSLFTNLPVYAGKCGHCEASGLIVATVQARPILESMGVKCPSTDAICISCINGWCANIESTPPTPAASGFVEAPACDWCGKVGQVSPVGECVSRGGSVPPEVKNLCRECADKFTIDHDTVVAGTPFPADRSVHVCQLHTQVDFGFALSLLRDNVMFMLERSYEQDDARVLSLMEKFDRLVEIAALSDEAARDNVQASLSIMGLSKK